MGSARKLAKLCESHIAYKWLCGGVSVNYHLLSDFRSKHHEKWKYLFTQVVSSLLEQGLVSMTRVAQDGMRVRANAGRGSFRSKTRLEQFFQEVEEQLEALEQQEEESSAECTKRQQAAHKQAKANRKSRIEKALENCESVRKQQEESKKKKKPKGKPKQARASTTDATR